VTVQCTKDGYFIVVVAKDATLPALDLNTISLYGEGPSCTYVDSNSEFAIYYFAVTQCGTLVREEEPGVIIYENIMASYFDVQSGHLGQITRDTTYNLFFQCRYTATSVNSLVIELLPSDPPQPVASIGPVRVLMRLANGKCTTKGCNEVEAAFTSFYTDEEYPVLKVLREPVYVQVEILERTDPLVVLTLDHCWTTTSPNPHTFPQWDILINGCPNPADPYTSELVSVTTDVEFPEHYKRFLFKMFAFVDSVSVEPTYQQIYLHCSTSLCIAAPCRQCFPACFTKLKVLPVEFVATQDTILLGLGTFIY
uniref:ZP domain-containing protein n=1 Tax=Tetraodon nigroviridis TaxID=99883 RepID=H3BXB2_TETNG